MDTYVETFGGQWNTTSYPPQSYSLMPYFSNIIISVYNSSMGSMPLSYDTATLLGSSISINGNIQTDFYSGILTDIGDGQNGGTSQIYVDCTIQIQLYYYSQPSLQCYYAIRQYNANGQH